MEQIFNKILGSLVFIIILVFYALLIPFIPIALFIYLIYRIRKNYLRKKLIKQIELEWFPKGKYVFFLYSISEKWKDYFEQELIPKIQDKTVIWNWSTRHENGWNEDLLEAKILSLFRSAEHFFPMAVVFLPSGKFKIFRFYTPYIRKMKSEKKDYDEMEKEFLKLVESIKD